MDSILFVYLILLPLLSTKIASNEALKPFREVIWFDKNNTLATSPLTFTPNPQGKNPQYCCPTRLPFLSDMRIKSLLKNKIYCLVIYIDSVGCILVIALPTLATLVRDSIYHKRNLTRIWRHFQDETCGISTRFVWSL